MNEINKTYNLDAHYSTSSKVKLKPFVASAPNYIPHNNVYTDEEISRKVAQINLEVEMAAMEVAGDNWKKFLWIF